MPSHSQFYSQGTDAVNDILYPRQIISILTGLIKGYPLFCPPGHSPKSFPRPPKPGWNPSGPDGQDRLHNHVHVFLFLFHFDFRNNPGREEKGHRKKDNEKGEKEGKERLDDGRDFDEFIARKIFGEGFNLQLNKKKINGRNKKIANETSHKVFEGKGDNHGNGIAENIVLDNKGFDFFLGEH
jgi:hypothetical protein